MASTRRHRTYAAYALLFLAMTTTVLGEQTDPTDQTLQQLYKGCYSSSAGLTNYGTYKFQSLGWCENTCKKANKAVFGNTDAAYCWCGNELPPASAKVDDSKCNVGCQGYPEELCGGDGYWSVYLTGTEENVPTATGSGSSSTGTKTATVGSPSVVTQVSPGKTVVVTKEASASEGAQSSHSGGGTNTTAIAAGIVVAVVIISGALAGLFFWIRHRRRQAEEEEFRQNQVADFMRGGERKPPLSGYSSTSDSRLDPEFGNKRNSHGSIADNEDFSRKILRVANPDRS